MSLGFRFVPIVDDLSLLSKSDLAEELLEESLSKGKKVAETDPYVLLTAMHTLGGLHDDKGEYDIAEQFYKDCLSLSSKVLGEDHQDTLLSLYNLAMFYFKHGDHNNAKPLLYEHSSKKEKVLGADHPDTLQCKRNLEDMEKEMEAVDNPCILS